MFFYLLICNLLTYRNSGAIQGVSLSLFPANRFSLFPNAEIWNIEILKAINLAVYIRFPSAY